MRAERAHVWRVHCSQATRTYCCSKSARPTSSSSVIHISAISFAHELVLTLCDYPSQPGDYLKPGEPDREGLQARLHRRIGPDKAHDDEADTSEDGAEWDVVDSLAQWWRPNFEGFMYPYIPGSAPVPRHSQSNTAGHF